MSKNPTASHTQDVTVGGASYPAVTYRAVSQTFTVMFDRTTGLPARVRTLDYDNIWGDVTYDLVLADWQVVEGVQVATSQKYELNGRTVVDAKITEVKINAPVAADRVAIPAAFREGAAGPADRNVPYQWVIRRQFIGTYLDSEAPSFDRRATGSLRLVELGPGIQHVVGGSPNSLVVEMKNSLVVFDSPVSDWQSNWTLSTLRAKYLGKPVKYLVLTHHHMDHAGGIRAYASTGSRWSWARAPPSTIAACWPRRTRATPISAAGSPAHPDRRGRGQVLDHRRAAEAQVYAIEPNPHAQGLLIGFVPDAKLAYATDIWSPGAGPLPDKLNPGLAALVAGVKKAGIEPPKFAGGHGSTADYAPLAALEGK